MSWYDNIYKLGIEKLDLGPDFRPAERYEYGILTYDEKENEDKIPGHFTSLKGVEKRIKELAKEVMSKIAHKCNVCKEIKVDKSEELTGPLGEEVEEKRNDKLMKRIANGGRRK